MNEERLHEGLTEEQKSLLATQRPRRIIEEQS